MLLATVDSCRSRIPASATPRAIPAWLVAGACLRRIAAGRQGGADGDELRWLRLRCNDRAPGPDSARLSSVPVPSLRYTVQRAQRRWPQSRLAAEQHYRFCGVLGPV